jgi:hypothetical protein
MRRLGPVLLAILVVSPAHAEELAGARSLDLTVQGRLSERCAIGPVEDHSFGDLTRPSPELVTRVPLSCNLPVNITIRSANGGLANDSHPRGQGPYAGTVPYNMAVSLPVRMPAQSVVTQSFDSTELMAGRTISSNGGIAVDGMTLNIALARPTSEAGLLGGNYSEVIEITVTPG